MVRIQSLTVASSDLMGSHADPGAWGKPSGRGFWPALGLGQFESGSAMRPLPCKRSFEVWAHLCLTQQITDACTLPRSLTPGAGLRCWHLVCASCLQRSRASTVLTCHLLPCCAAPDGARRPGLQRPQAAPGTAPRPLQRQSRSGRLSRARTTPMSPLSGPGSTPTRQPRAQPAAPLGTSLSARCLQSTSLWALQPSL